MSKQVTRSLNCTFLHIASCENWMGVALFRL